MGKKKIIERLTIDYGISDEDMKKLEEEVKMGLITWEGVLELCEETEDDFTSKQAQEEMEKEFPRDEVETDPIEYGDIDIIDS